MYRSSPLRSIEVGQAKILTVKNSHDYTYGKPPVGINMYTKLYKHLHSCIFQSSACHGRVIISCETLSCSEHCSGDSEQRMLQCCRHHLWHQDPVVTCQGLRVTQSWPVYNDVELVLMLTISDNDGTCKLYNAMKYPFRPLPSGALPPPPSGEPSFPQHVWDGCRFFTNKCNDVSFVSS